MGGTIIQYSSYKAVFYAMGAAFAVQLLLVFFWVPETALVRHGVLNIDIDTVEVTISPWRSGAEANFRSSRQLETDIKDLDKPETQHIHYKQEPNLK
jgi:hypothetical protein